jgi:hypothetical protein
MLGFVALNNAPCTKPLCAPRERSTALACDIVSSPLGQTNARNYVAVSPSLEFQEAIASFDKFHGILYTSNDIQHQVHW